MADGQSYGDSMPSIKSVNSQNAPKGLTPRMRALLAFIQAYSARHEQMPSFQEMADGLGLRSKSSVHRLITSLEERGHIERLHSRARAMHIPGVQAVTTISALGAVIERCRMTPDTEKEMRLILAREIGRAQGVIG